MFDFLLPSSEAKSEITRLFKRHEAGTLDTSETPRPADNPDFSTRLVDGRDVDIVWIERFEAMFDDRSMILGEAINSDRETIPIAWHPDKQAWVSFIGVSWDSRDELLATEAQISVK